MRRSPKEKKKKAVLVWQVTAVVVVIVVRSFIRSRSRQAVLATTEAAGMVCLTRQES